MRKYVYSKSLAQIWWIWIVDEIDINRIENSSLTNYVNDIKASVYFDRFIHCIVEFRRPTHISITLEIGNSNRVHGCCNGHYFDGFVCDTANINCR